MKHKLDEMEKWLKIDRENLDEEVMRQPELFYRVSAELASAISDRDGAKDLMNRTEARIKEDIREEWRKEEKKFTVTEVDDAASRHPKFKSRQEEYRAASQRVELVSAMKEAFQQRSYMLRELSSLWVNNYFQDSSTKSGDTKKVEDAKYRDRREKLSKKRESI